MTYPSWLPRSSALAAIALYTLGMASTPARALPPGYFIETVHPGLNIPVVFGFAPDHRLFYGELRTGRVMTYPTPTSPTASLWAILPIASVGERGLLGMAFHPDFPDSPYVYFYHTDVNLTFNRVARLTDQAGVGVSYALLRDSIPAGSPSHNGGRLAFGPDRMLYVTYGEQLMAGAARDSSDIRGKILRLLPNGRIPPNNPYGPTNPAALMGIRNVFGICFDPVSGEGYFTDNGPDCNDEVNHLRLHGDYGWGFNYDCSGFREGAISPLASFTPNLAPTGCCIYRGGAYPDNFEGDLFFGGFLDSSIRRMSFSPGFPDSVESLEVFGRAGDRVLDFRVGPDSLIWVSTHASIQRIRWTPADVPRDLTVTRLGARPNPFVRSVTLALPRDHAVWRLEVLDLTGRQLRQWTEPLPEQLVWDGRDAGGRPVPPGVYLARAWGFGAPVTRLIVRLSR